MTRKIFTIIGSCIAVAAMTVFNMPKAEAQTIGTKECRAVDSFIEVSGYAEKEVAPDTFYLRIDIRESDSKGRKTVAEQEKEMLKYLKSQGLDVEKQLTRLNLGSNFYSKRTNYATASYSLKLKDTDNVAQIWRGLDQLGLSSVSFVKAECSKLDQIKEEVRRDAVLNAKKQAQIMADALGQTLGPAFYVNGGYSSNASYNVQPRLMMKSMAYSTENDTIAVEEEEQISFNDIKVNITLTVKFVLNM